jgi:hypothetical protein
MVIDPSIIVLLSFVSQSRGFLGYQLRSEDTLTLFFVVLLRPELLYFLSHLISEFKKLVLWILPALCFC